MNDTYTIARKNDASIDQLEAAMLEYRVEDELVHTFTPGLYSREMAALAGQIIVSKIHRTEHQYCVLRGSAYIMDNNGEWGFIQAPFVGITKCGTRRVFMVTEDLSWITFHATTKTTVAEIEQEIIEPHINSVLGTELKNYINLLNQKLCLGLQ